MVNLKSKRQHVPPRAAYSRAMKMRDVEDSEHWEYSGKAVENGGDEKR